MGIYDREYYQEDGGQRGITLGGKPRMVVTNLVLITAAVWIVNLFTVGGKYSDGYLNSQFALHPDLLFQPWHAYQLLTYGFLHAGIWHIGLNMFMLWMFGRVIEMRLGRMEFLLFYLVSIVFAGLAYLVMGYTWVAMTGEGLGPVVGASGGVTAVFIMFVLYYPRETVYVWGLLAVPAWLVGAIIVGQDLILGMTGNAGRTAWEAHIGGALFAFLYLKLGWRLSRLVPSSQRGGWKMPKRRPRLRVHDPEDDVSELAAEADRILAKVHRQGEQSLTNRERRTLERYSRQVRNKRT